MTEALIGSTQRRYLVTFPLYTDSIKQLQSSTLSQSISQPVLYRVRRKKCILMHFLTSKKRSSARPAGFRRLHDDDQTLPRSGLRCSGLRAATAAPSPPRMVDEVAARDGPESNPADIAQSNPPAAKEPASAVVFKSRRRPQKARKRVRVGREAGDDGVVSDDGKEEDGASADVAMLREARRLRDQARRIHTVTAPRARDETNGVDPTAAADNGAAGGLRNNFAVESSGYDAQRNMQQFVEERMAAKYGSRVAEGRPGKEAAAISDDDGDGEGYGEGDAGAARRKRPKVSADDAEAGLYVIPEHLRVPARQQYDPTEGLPAAGVEEVDIGATARRRNAELTALAQARLEAERVEAGGGQRGRDAEPGVIGNVSANFSQHRRDWIENRIQEERSARRDGGERQGRGSETAQGKGAGRGQDAARGEGGPPDSDAAAGKFRRRPAALASDHVLSERFRKRWKK